MTTFSSFIGNALTSGRYPFSKYIITKHDINPMVVFGAKDIQTRSFNSNELFPKSSTSHHGSITGSKCGWSCWAR